jgi:transposase
MTSLEQRHEIKHLTQGGKKAPEIAAMLGLSVHTVRKWQQRIKKGDLSIRS